MSFTEDLLAGFAQLLDDADVGVYRGDGSEYQASEVAIVFGAMPPAPDHVVCLTPYVIDDDGGLAFSTQGLQIRSRGDATDSLSALIHSDAAFDALQALSGVVVNGIGIAQCYRRSGAPIGPDDSGRYEHSDNYAIDLSRPTSHRPT